MAFALGPDRRELRERVRAFGERELAPVAREYDRRGDPPVELIERAAEAGFVGSTIPEAYGGPGRDMLGSAIVTEELWRADTGLGWAVGLSGFPGNVHLLVEHAPEWLREEYLPRIAAGEVIDGIAITEPEHGSDVAGMETTAERQGDRYVLDGEKKFIGNGTIADQLIVAAKTDPGAGHRGISLLYVPTDDVDAEPMTGTLGGGAADLAWLSFDGVEVPADRLIGAENEGFYHLMEGFSRGRVAVAARGVGAAAAGLDAAREYATDREQFDRPIGEFQAVKHHLAGMSARTEAARALCYRAATKVATGAEDADRFANTAKLFASEASCEVTDAAIQVHGGNGYLAEHDVERYYRDARGTRIYEGANDVLRNVVGDAVRDG